MTPSHTRHSAAHISNAPEDSYLLGLQLQHEGLDVAIVPVADRSALDDALAIPVSMIVADLPLPWDGADAELGALQRDRPDIPVVFRWGGAGGWSVEDGASQLGRSVRSALALGMDDGQTAEQRRALLHEVVRYQKLQWRLGQLDPWDWESALRDATAMIADTMQVERVGVWRLDAAHALLDCDALYIRSRREHFVGGALPLDAAYRRAIEAATFVAADDACLDPRTSAFNDDYLRPLGITSMLDAPIRSRGRVVGVVCLEHVGPSRRWSVVEQCAAAAFAGIVGRILEARERRHIEEQCQEAQRLEVIGRMAAAVAHDFGNLSTVIAGFSESVLTDLAADDPHREALLAIHEAGISATQLVRQLMAYSKPQPVDAGAIDLRRELQALEPLVRRLLGSSIECTVSVPDDGLWARVDPVQIQRVVLNLAANSRDAMPHGGSFTLILDDCAAAGDPLRPLGVVRLRAIDTGHGIPADVVPHIFKPLFTTKADTGGTGLGLAAVRAICAQAGGSVGVESVIGESTCFTVEFPRVPSTEPAAARPAIVGAPPLRGVVLVVDDTPSMATLVRRMLERQGYTAEEFASPHLALERALALGSDLGLIVTDFNMRGMSGTQLLERIRMTRADMPAIIMTGQIDVKEVTRYAESPNTAVLAKPFDSRTLIAAVRLVMSQAHLART